MTHSTFSPTESQQRLEDSIADYVRGTLDPLQGAAIEQRQARDADFARLILQERALQTHFAEVRAAAVLPTPSFAALRERLQRPTLLEQIRGWLVAPPLRPSWATAAALGVLIAAAGLWRIAPSDDDPQKIAALDAPAYQTLTAAAATPRGAEWRLVFAAGASQEARAALLRDFDLQALSEADALGSLWVRGRAPNDALADRLRSDRRLIVVQSAPRQPAP